MKKEESIYQDERPGAVILKGHRRRKEPSAILDMGILAVFITVVAFAFWLGIRLATTHCS